MKIPLSLIKAFIKLDLPPAKIGEILTLLGIEVDAIEHAQPPFAKVVVAEILTTKPHPDAKNLQVAEVNDGQKTHTVVCGAANCRAGMKTAFAQVGAVLTDADGMQRRIEKTSIRGVESFGMLCSGKELGISKDLEGILDLPSDFKRGDDVAHLLWDPVFELSLTPNLGHCMSALGVARELAAALSLPIPKTKSSKWDFPPFSVTVHEKGLALRYMCCLIEGVKVGPSPFWLKNQLEACGQKSINNLVDATNYIMMKRGQPLHAFDADKIAGHQIHISKAKAPFKFLGLDGVEREAPKDALIISDKEKPIALAGVMGGENSAVTETTTKVILEGASFDPISVRLTSKKVALRTESSQRFEKGVDPAQISEALFEAATLMGGRVSAFFDSHPEEFKMRKIPYRTKRVNQILGTKLSETEIEEILARLNIETKDRIASIPSYRKDLVEEIDLIEEVARVYGYNNIEKSIPLCSTSTLPNDPVFLFENEMRELLTRAHLSEFLSCDLLSPALAEISREITSFSMIQTVYSKSEEFSFLRTSLLPGLLQSVKGNFAKKNHNIFAFEIGRIHFVQKSEVEEIPMVGILLTGNREDLHWSQKLVAVDFFDLKGILENLLEGTFKASNHPFFHPGRQADVHIEDLIVGSLGEVHPRLSQKFDIEAPIYYAELNLLHLLKVKKTHLKMTPLPQFPASERDLTLTLPLKAEIGSIFETIQKHKSPLLEKVELIDLYLPDGKDVKNATFRFVYRDLLKTISFEEAEREHAKMVHRLQ
jgi:phenylalanyl-tRNA synthetase beta chain